MKDQHEIPVTIELNTKQQQNNETSNYFTKSIGKFINMGDNSYLRYIEKGEDNKKIIVTFKISSDGTILLKRSFENISNRLYFNINKKIESPYHTPYGTISLVTQANAITTAIDDNSMTGDIHIDYHLYNNNQLLGKYQIRLHFYA